MHLLLPLQDRMRTESHSVSRAERRRAAGEKSAPFQRVEMRYGKRPECGFQCDL